MKNSKKHINGSSPFKRIRGGLILCLILLCSCSSDDDKQSTTFNVLPSPPLWTIDWMWHDEAPAWQSPAPTKFECSMYMLVELDQNLQPYSTDNDQMAIFINDECRGVSYRNVYPDGHVVFLLHVKGNSTETEEEMELRYYSDGMHQLFVSNAVPPFTPNNILEEAFQMILELGDGSTKYPYRTELNVELPESLPSTPSEGDKMAVFVGDECRGICNYNKVIYNGWRGVVFSYEPGETAQVRYYSSDKGGVYTFGQTFVLNNDIQTFKLSNT